MLFRLPLPEGNCRRPDVAFVSSERVRASTLSLADEAWSVVPDLAVEVLGPGDLAECVAARIADFFRAGVLVVWVVSPQLRLVHVYESLTQVRGLQGGCELEGGTVLPGFRLPLAELFPTDEGAAADATAT
jgi:Uma2 family endonuclease